MRVNLFAALLALLAFAGATSAEARRCISDKAGYQRTVSHRVHQKRRTHTARSSVEGRPRQWCGWWMRTQKGGGPDLNLAANWRRWGSPSGPQIGAVAVWPHHVGMITGRTTNGQWIIKSGNDGGAVRERARSVAGAVFRIG